MGDRHSRMAFKLYLLRVHREQRMPPTNFGFSIAARRNFFDTKHKSQEQGVEHKALSRSRFRAQSQISRAACMERTPVCEHKSYPRAGLRSRHCAKRQLSGTGVLEMRYLRAGSVPNSMS